MTGHDVIMYKYTLQEFMSYEDFALAHLRFMSLAVEFCRMFFRRPMDGLMRAETGFGLLVRRVVRGF